MKPIIAKVAATLILCGLPIAPALADNSEAYKATVAFSLDSERNTIEYRHGDQNIKAAHDQAMLHAAKFFLSQGKTNFKVEEVTVQSDSLADMDASTLALYCGEFVCSDRVLPTKNDATNADIVVRLSIVSGQDARKVDAPSFNTGQIINRFDKRNSKTLYAAVAP